MPIYHVKSNTIADGTNTDLVRPGDWNSAHAYTLQDAVSITGNTAGTLANISSGTFYLAGGSNITLSQDGNTVSVVAAAGGGNNQTGSIYADSNSFGTSSGTYDLRSLSIEGSGGVSVAASNGGFVVSRQQPITLSDYDPYLNSPRLSTAGNSSTMNMSGSIYFQPFDLFNYLNANRLNLFVYLAPNWNNVAANGSDFFSISVALYTRGSSDSTDRLMIHWSCSALYGFINNSGSLLSFTNVVGISNSTAVSTISTTFSQTSASSYLTYVGSRRVIPFPISSTLNPGRYWFAIGVSRDSSNTSVARLAATFPIVVINNYLRGFVPYGGVKSNSFNSPQIGLGVYNTTSNSFPEPVYLTAGDISHSFNTYTKFLFNFSGYTTGSVLP